MELHPQAEELEPVEVQVESMEFPEVRAVERDAVQVLKLEEQERPIKAITAAEQAEQRPEVRAVVEQTQ